jgi:hypothetical protein
MHSEAVSGMQIELGFFFSCQAADIFPDLVIINRYFQDYYRSKSKRTKEEASFIAMDAAFPSQYVYRRKPEDIVRFSEFHPDHASEAFFYNLLLDKYPFRDEAKLLSSNNTG